MTEKTLKDDPLTRLTLSNLGGRDINGRSGAEELFAEHLADVLANVARLDTDATTKRSITLKIEFTPNADRNIAEVEVSAVTKLAPLNSAHGRVALGVDFGEQIAVPIMETMPLFDVPKTGAPLTLKAVAKPEASGQ